MHNLPILIVGITTLTVLINSLPFSRNAQRRGRFGSSLQKTNFSIDELWYTQQLDHLNPADNRTWQQRYFVNDQYWKKDGPVFIFIAGEGAANPIWMTEGQWITYAQTYGAICVMVEHRFYGKSHPTEDLSVENLRYLSSEQALSDLATFHDYFNSQYQVSTQAKWISFGGSYPGALSAWFRLKYPDLVYGAISSSGPVTALIDFREYLVVVDKSLATYDEKCDEAISGAIKEMQIMIESPAGRVELQKDFSLCDAIDIEKDVDTFFLRIAENFEIVVQYNRANRAFEGVSGIDLSIDVVCEAMLNDSIPNVLQRMINVNNMILDAYGERCLDINYTRMINQYRETSWDSAYAAGERQWKYQTCVEFGFFQSSNDSQQPFGNNFPTSYFVQKCADIYGANFSQARVEKGVNFTNEYYGAKKFQGSRVVFVNGAIDPWHVLSIIDDPPNNNTAIFLQTTAHCADMSPDAESDPEELRQARKTISDIIGRWLQ